MAKGFFQGSYAALEILSLLSGIMGVSITGSDLERV